MQEQKIHKNALGGFVGSLLQLSHGETVANHGFLVWNLAEDTVKEVNIDNPYSLHNVYLKVGTDYDDLKWLSLPLTQYNKIMVHWEDYSANMNKENLDKIRHYLMNLNPSPTEIRFKRKPLDKDIERIAIDDLRLDNISDVVVQRDIISEHLKLLQYGDETISDVLSIDEIITERLSAKGVGQGGRNDCRILRLDIDNFKSFGEGVHVDFQGNDGVWQIVGENQFGKSSFLESLMYLYYGKTTDVRGREKHSDNRYINFKQDLDYCQVSGEHEINNQFYRLVRRTEREWKRSKGVNTIKSLTTTFSIYRLDEQRNVVENESIDKRRETEKLIAQSIGNYEDFLRSSFISADTLNGLISTDHSQFLDALLRDIGLDVFEKKLDEFKSWKKEVFSKMTKYVVDVNIENVKIKEWEQEIINAHDEMAINKEGQKNIALKIKKGRSYKEEQLTKLFPIDSVISSTSKDKIQAEINAFFNQKELKEREIQTFIEKLSHLHTEYDEVKCNFLRSKEEEIHVSIRAKKTVISESTNEQEKVGNKKNYIIGEIKLLERKIDSIFAQEIKEQEFINRNIKLIEKEITQLQESQYCPTCERIKDDAAIVAIKYTIGRKNESIKELIEEIKNVSLRFTTEKEELLNEINVKKESTKPLDEEISGYDISVSLIHKEVGDLTVELTSIGIDVKTCEIAQQQLLKRQKLELEMAIIPVQLEKIDLQIAGAKIKYSNFQQAERLLFENEKIQAQIEKAQIRLTDLEAEKKGLELREAYIKENIISYAEHQIRDTNIKLDIYRAQDKRDTIHKLYEDCFHRDGIPAVILTKSLKFINKQLEELLDDVNFRIFIDEEFTFRMIPVEFPDHTMSALSGSGMERTFAALVLRIALRMLNNKTRNNILLLDEVLGKLDINNVHKFLAIIQKIKVDFDKVLIIEHAHSDLIEEDYRLNVLLDENKVASLELI